MRPLWLTWCPTEVGMGHHRQLGVERDAGVGERALCVLGFGERHGEQEVAGRGVWGSEREWVWQEAGAGFRAAVVFGPRVVVGGKLWVDGTQQVGGLVYVMVRELVVTPDGVISPVQQVQEGARYGGVVGDRLLDQVLAFSGSTRLDVAMVVDQAEVIGVELVDLMEQGPFLVVGVRHDVDYSSGAGFYGIRLSWRGVGPLGAGWIWCLVGISGVAGAADGKAATTRHLGCMPAGVGAALQSLPHGRDDSAYPCWRGETTAMAVVAIPTGGGYPCSRGVSVGTTV